MALYKFFTGYPIAQYGDNRYRGNSKKKQLPSNINNSNNNILNMDCFIPANRMYTLRNDFHP